MLRSILLFLIGAGSAGVGTYLSVFADSSGHIAAGTYVETGEIGALRDGRRSLKGTHLGAYRGAAGLDDTGTVETLLGRAADVTFSVSRDAEIWALFERLAELNMNMATRFADGSAHDIARFASAFRFWAENDAESALGAVAAIATVETRHAVAMTVVEALGGDEGAIERVAAELPEYERADFFGKALAQLSRDDPESAIDAALRLVDGAARNGAAQRIGVSWVRDNPIAAFDHAAVLPPELQDAYLTAVASEWARLDTDGFLEFAATQSTLDRLLGGLSLALASSPAGVFEIAVSSPPINLGTMGPLDAAALSALAERDIDEAIERVEELAGGPRQQRLWVAIAEVYGRKNPEEALAWARSLDPPVPLAEVMAGAGMAIVDLEKAIQTLRGITLPEGLAPSAINSLIAEAIAKVVTSDSSYEAIASALLPERDDPLTASILRSLTAQWVANDPDRVFTWMLENISSVDAAFAGVLAEQLATRDARNAAALAISLPIELQREWRDEVAVPFARQDPRGAADWVMQYRNEPDYGRLIQEVVTISAATDPFSAARLVASAPEGFETVAAINVAGAWAAEDLRGAANWAVGLSHPASRESAVAIAASSWAARDPDEAQAWALTLPRGATRDLALAVVLRELLYADLPAGRIANSFDSADVREQLISDTVSAMARSDPDRAQNILDEWMVNETLREQGQEAIDTARRTGL